MANILLAGRGCGDLPTTNPLARTGGPTSLNGMMSLRLVILNGITTRVRNVKIQRSLKSGSQITMMQHGIAYEDVYNFDETGHAMGIIATAKVVTRADIYGRCQVIHRPGHGYPFWYRSRTHTQRYVYTQVCTIFLHKNP